MRDTPPAARSWRSVTHHEPCPNCHKPNWCCRSPRWGGHCVPAHRRRWGTIGSTRRGEFLAPLSARWCSFCSACLWTAPCGGARSGQATPSSITSTARCWANFPWHPTIAIISRHADCPMERSSSAPIGRGHGGAEPHWPEGSSSALALMCVARCLGCISEGRMAVAAAGRRALGVARQRDLAGLRPPRRRLTATQWRGRRLGKSEIVDVPNDATWVATGNNVELSDEIARRTIPIRLDPGVGAAGTAHRLRPPRAIAMGG